MSDVVRVEFPEEPPNGTILVSGDATNVDCQAWQRRDHWLRKVPQDHRWYPAGSYLPGPSSDSDNSVQPLMWRQLIAQLWGRYTVVWQPPDSPTDT